MKLSADQLEAGRVEFDCVLMLTWSDWHTEPRSNRYHYATRFARHVPVVFLQPTLRVGSSPEFQDSGVPGLEILALPNPVDAGAAARVLKVLSERGLRRPLLWIYSTIHYDGLLRALPNTFRVYHATEDYLTPSPTWGLQDHAYIVGTVRRLMPQVDLVVGVSERVLDAYVQLGGYLGPTVLAPNGCDAPFFASLGDDLSARDCLRVCIFQGGINRRLDFALLEQVVDNLPDWEFRFCGKVQPEAAEQWSSIAAKRNVRYLGMLSALEVAREMAAASVGLIPFVQDELIWNSLPLKAYEYVACGLPVVSVGIEALLAEPELFSIARTPQAFAEAIVRAGETRADSEALQARRKAAARNSYDERFRLVVAAVNQGIVEARRRTKRLNVAVLYDDGSVHVNTVSEHLQAFARYSRHKIYYMPVCVGESPSFTFGLNSVDSRCPGPDFSIFDVLVIHYSVRISKPTGHMAQEIKDACARFAGLKVLFIQDEYDNIQVAQNWIADVKLDLVYTCVPPEYVAAVYRGDRFAKVEFLPTLTGYVPEDPGIDAYAQPLGSRRIFIGYRGRQLPAIYGRLGYEKYLIGTEVRRLAEPRGLHVDIEVDDERRVYGSAWYRFLGGARATLGTESGSNLFDFDGSASAQIERARLDGGATNYPALESVLKPYEASIEMNQISPKIFEAIRTRTALVLFEGSYSGVVQPHIHYLPLKKDFSNFDDVVAALADDDLVSSITDRAYKDIVASGRYSYAAFVAGFDLDVEQRIVRPSNVIVAAVPLMVRRDDEVEHMVPSNASAFLLSTTIMDLESRGAFERQAEKYVRAPLNVPPASTSSVDLRLGLLVVRRAWRKLPEPFRALVGRMRTTMRNRLYKLRRSL